MSAMSFLNFTHNIDVPCLLKKNRICILNSYSWNINASDPVNALMNYGYVILESIVKKDINTVVLMC